MIGQLNKNITILTGDIKLMQSDKATGTFNLCTPFKHNIHCASLCGVEFVVTKERREKRTQRESCLKRVQRVFLHFIFSIITVL